MNPCSMCDRLYGHLVGCPVRVAQQALETAARSIGKAAALDNSLLESYPLLEYLTARNQVPKI